MVRYICTQRVPDGSACNTKGTDTDGETGDECYDPPEHSRTETNATQGDIIVHCHASDAGWAMD